jgi:hypothetical protein
MVCEWYGSSFLTWVGNVVYCSLNIWDTSLVSCLNHFSLVVSSGFQCHWMLGWSYCGSKSLPWRMALMSCCSKVEHVDKLTPPTNTFMIYFGKEVADVDGTFVSWSCLLTVLRHLFNHLNSIHHNSLHGTGDRQPTTLLDRYSGISICRKATHTDTNMYHTIHQHVRSPYNHSSKQGKNTQNYWAFGNLQGKNS